MTFTTLQNQIKKNIYLKTKSTLAATVARQHECDMWVRKEDLFLKQLPVQIQMSQISPGAVITPNMDEPGEADDQFLKIKDEALPTRRKSGMFY